MKEYMEIQAEEARTWCIEDPETRNEKLTRETVRYPYLAKLMGLSHLDTSGMIIYDIGGGPVGVSSVIPCKQRTVVDPLTHEYAKFFDTTFHMKAKAEDLEEALYVPDLVVVTNAMDHFEYPEKFMQDLVAFSKPGSYFAQFHAINNALTHRHEAHDHNINPEFIHRFLDSDYETVWEIKYPEVRYGWVKYEGKVGQPAFCGLHRKTTGYSS